MQRRVSQGVVRLKTVGILDNVLLLLKLTLILLAYQPMLISHWFSYLKSLAIYQCTKIIPYTGTPYLKMTAFPSPAMMVGSQAQRTAPAYQFFAEHAYGLCRQWRYSRKLLRSHSGQ